MYLYNKLFPDIHIFITGLSTANHTKQRLKLFIKVFKIPLSAILSSPYNLLVMKFIFSYEYYETSLFFRFKLLNAEG